MAKTKCKSNLSANILLWKRKTKKPKPNSLPLTPKRVNAPKYNIKPISSYYQANIELTERVLLMLSMVLEYQSAKQQ